MGLMDRSPWNLGRSGFQRHARTFDPADLDVDLSGKVALVTGANSGIGFSVARGLAARGAEVWLLCRDEGRARRAQARIVRHTGNDNVRIGLLDLVRAHTIEDFVEEFPRERIDLLVHCAGVLAECRQVVDGIERTLATQVVGPLQLTAGLQDRLGASSRVVFVAGSGAFGVPLEVRALNSLHGDFEPLRVHARCKRAVVHLAELLALALAHQGVVVHAMHPGWTDTPSVRSRHPWIHRVAKQRLRNAEEGADTALYLAVSEEPARRTGGYWFDRRRVRSHWGPWSLTPIAEQHRLWRAAIHWARIDADHPFSSFLTGPIT